MYYLSVMFWLEVKEQAVPKTFLECFTRLYMLFQTKMYQSIKYHAVPKSSKSFFLYQNRFGEM